MPTSAPKRDHAIALPCLTREECAACEMPYSLKSLCTAAVWLCEQVAAVITQLVPEQACAKQCSNLWSRTL